MVQSTDALDAFLASASSRPSHLAISLRNGTSLTYDLFECRARSFAGALSRLNVERVLIGLPQGPDAYAAMIGAGLAGCYYCPLNLEAPNEKLHRITRTLEPDVIVAQRGIAESLLAAAPRAKVVCDDDPLGPPLTGRGARHKIAYIIFTSGTSGVPKGVVIPRSSLDHFVDWIRSSETITCNDRVPQFSNIAFDISITDIYGALCLGATLFPVLGKADRMFPARMVSRERLTVWNSTPSVVSLMMRAGEVTIDLLHTLRLINMCGEPLLRTHVSALFKALPDVVVQNSYGPTETTVTMTALRLTQDNFEAACRDSVAIGDPIEHMSIHLLGGSHPDEGEIVISGPQLAEGYWNDPEKTAKLFRMVDIDGKQVRGYFSGDHAERHSNQIFFKERIDLQVKIKGFRVELSEVSRAINDLGYPVTCVIKWKDTLAAVVERHPSVSFDEVAIRAHLATQLEPHAIPTVLREMDRIPRTENDKLDSKAVARWLEG